MLRLAFFVFVLTLVSSGAACAAKVDNWQQIIRGTPYWMSQGVAQNLETLRRWVLLGDGYCSDIHRHILYDRRGAFLTWLEDQATVPKTQEAIDRVRARLADDGKVEDWTPGGLERIGYPFALACDQPHVSIEDAVARLTGTDPAHRIWGTWDDLSIGTSQRPVPLIEVFTRIYEDRQAKGRYTFPESALSLLLGQVIIESGGQKNALSVASAKGLMQLRPEVLSDCQVPQRLYYHRMAQIDCALKLLQQNHRNLKGPFHKRFGHLPEGKREALYLRLLLQAYHGGIGRVLSLLDNGETGKAAHYFAEHHDSFSSRDIALGMTFHNLGRLDLGFASLYYATDVEIAAEALCEQLGGDSGEWCKSG